MIYIEQTTPSPQTNLFSDDDGRLSQEAHGVFHDDCDRCDEGCGGDKRATSSLSLITLQCII